MLNINQRISLMARLGDYIITENDTLKSVVKKTHFNNQWFTIENINDALKSIASQFLKEENLLQWIENYKGNESGTQRKKIGLILAGNIPLVGFHDVLSCFIAGHTAMIKSSSKDPYLLAFLIDKIVEWNTDAASYFEFVERLNGFDGVIATGSNNSAKQFEFYFSKYPNIIRRNRNGVAVLDGNESEQQLIDLGKDIFGFFGMGCRNVSKIYIPKDYDVKILLEILHNNYKQLVMHHKYKNNYDYNYTIYLMNKDIFLMSGSLILKEDKSLNSRIACLHYERYDDEETLKTILEEQMDQIQCIVTDSNLFQFDTITYGASQSPGLLDYADGVDTMSFLCGL